MQYPTEILRKKVMECMVERGADFTQQKTVLIVFQQLMTITLSHMY